MNKQLNSYLSKDNNITYKQKGGVKVYVDNAYNRNLGRVGKTHGKYSLKTFTYEINVIPNILLFEKKDDWNVLSNPIDSKTPSIEKFTNNKTILKWFRKRTRDLGKYISTKSIKITKIEVNANGNKIKNGLKFLLTMKSIKKINDYDIDDFASMISDPDDDGNYPIKINTSKKYKNTALVLSKLSGWKNVTSN
jgi:hypothetical protein